MSVVFFFLLIVGQFILKNFCERNISIEDVIEKVLTERERSSRGIFLECFLWVLLCIPKSDFSSRSSPIRGYTGN